MDRIEKTRKIAEFSGRLEGLAVMSHYKCWSSLGLMMMKAEGMQIYQASMTIAATRVDELA